MDTFIDKLKYGQDLENEIMRKLTNLGFVILPLSNLPSGQFRGPRLMSPSGDIVSPDIMAIKDGKAIFIEIKRKAYPSFHRATGEWTSRIEDRLYKNYSILSEASGLPVWVITKIEDGNDICENLKGPTGLFIWVIDGTEKIHHRYGDHIYIGLNDSVELEEVI